MILAILGLLIATIPAHDNFLTLMGESTSRWRFVTEERDHSDLERYETLYNQNKDLQFADQGPYKIPCNVHLIWLGPKPFPIESVENIRMWMEHHPEWSLHFWTDRNRPPPVKGMVVHREEEFPLSPLAKHYEQARNWGQKSDILRYEILSQIGGVYIDHDADCLRPFDGLHRGYDFYCCLEAPHTRVDGRSITSGIGVIGAAPHHPVIEGSIDEVIAHWDETLNKFPTTSARSLRDYVMHSTYLALTRSLEKHLGEGGNSDIVLPASYFYPQKSLKPIYSYHHYATSWAGVENEKKSERDVRHLLDRVKKEGRHLIVLIGLTAAFSLCLLGRRR